MTPSSMNPSSSDRPLGSGAPSNPFSACRVEPGAIPLMKLSAGELYDRFAGLGRTAQVVGCHGAGKSTLLSHFAREARIRGEAVSLVRASRSGFPWSRGCSLLIVDEADSMPSWMTAGVRLACGLWGTGLLICVHADCGVPTLTCMEPDLPTTRGIVDYLCRGWRIRVPDDDELRGLMDRHAGNLRAVLFTLYDWYEQGLLEPRGDP